MNRQRPTHQIFQSLQDDLIVRYDPNQKELRCKSQKSALTCDPCSAIFFLFGFGKVKHFLKRGNEKRGKFGVPLVKKGTNLGIRSIRIRGIDIDYISVPRPQQECPLSV